MVRLSAGALRHLHSRGRRFGRYAPVTTGSGAVQLLLVPMRTKGNVVLYLDLGRLQTFVKGERLNFFRMV